MKSDLKVLYLLGFGRSGTTVMANVLGEVDGIVHAGELQRIWSRLTPDGSGRCGCGEQVKVCEFWGRVQDRLRSHLSVAPQRQSSPPDMEGLEPADVLRWQTRITGRDRMRLKLEDATRPGTLSPAAVHYRIVAAALYRAVAEVSGTNVIIDSTKVPQLGVLLQGMPGITPYYLQVIRDPRGVLYSRQKRQSSDSLDAKGRARLNRVSLAADALRWNRDNLLAARIRRRVGQERAALVRYEEFVSQPAAVLTDTLRMLGLKAELPMIDENTARIGPNHTVCGNRNRFESGVVAFREDLSWRESLGHVDRLIATMFAAPAMRRFGYSLNGGLPNGAPS